MLITLEYHYQSTPNTFVYSFELTQAFYAFSPMKNNSADLSPPPDSPSSKKQKVCRPKAAMPTQQPIIVEDSTSENMDITQNSIEANSGCSGETQATTNQQAVGQILNGRPSSVIIQLSDGKGNFLQTSPADLNQIAIVIRAAVGGATLQSRKMPGGDLMIYPGTLKQQQQLLALDQAAGRKMKSSLPRSAQFPSGIIKLVPTTLSDDDILQALRDQRVTEVRRFLRPSGINYLPTGTVKLTFSTSLPTSICLEEKDYVVELFVPKAYLCFKCGGLYHTQNKCPNAARCINCGSPGHAHSTSCSMTCVNCHSPNHNASSKSCPAFIEAQKAVELNKKEGITFQEALQRIRSQSSGAQTTVNNPWALPLPSSELEDLKRNVTALKEEVRHIREVQVPAALSVAVEAKSAAEEAEGKVDDFRIEFDDKIEGIQDAQSHFETNLIDTLASSSAQQTLDILKFLNERLPPPASSSRQTTTGSKATAATSSAMNVPPFEQLKLAFNNNFAKFKSHNRPTAAAQSIQADSGQGPPNGRK